MADEVLDLEDRGMVGNDVQVVADHRSLQPRPGNPLELGEVRALGVTDGVQAAIAGLEQIAIVARAALQQIVAGTAFEHVVAGAALQMIVAAQAAQPVGAAGADQLVGAGAARSGWAEVR